MARQTDTTASHRVRQLRPGLERLEDRTVPAYTATLTGTVATFTGDAGGDVLTFAVAGGSLQHNRFTVGDPGFASDLDFDSAVAGEQFLPAGSTAVVNANAGDGDDAVIVGTLAAPAATVTGRFNIDGQGGIDTVMWDNLSDATGRQVNIQGGIFNQVFIPFTGAAVGFGAAEVVSVLAGGGSDTITVSEPGLTAVSLDAGGGDDAIAFADGATLGGTLDGGAGTDTIDYSAYTSPVAVNLGTNRRG